MPSSSSYAPISDYGLLSDMHSCALVSSEGSIDWACFPRFDSPAVFSRILDKDKGGYFKISVKGLRSSSRRYIPDTNVLETTYETDTGVARLVDFMPIHDDSTPMQPREITGDQRIVRSLICDSGSVAFTVECYPRFDYGTIIPHAHLDTLYTGFAHGGANALSLWCNFPITRVDDGFYSEGRIVSGQRLCAVVTYESRFSHEVEALGEGIVEGLMNETMDMWRQWASICTYRGDYEEQVKRSALTLKALTYAPSGGLAAAATTSLPEEIGGSRNWDYRFTWIRDATFALYALFIIGYTEEAKAFKAWLEWSTVGRARDLQIMYGLGGERRLTEIEIGGLDGYRGSRPVRVGNGAYDQFQLDIYGEILDSAHLYRKYGGDLDEEYWEYLKRVVDFVIDHWKEPDEGLWEARGGRKHYVFSKAMCWVALDRAIKAARALDLPGDVELWRKVRAEIKQDILDKGFDAERGVFVQCYGSRTLDAANLMLPLIGFIKATDPRMSETIRAIERELTSPQGFVYRYRGFDDGIPGDEGVFNICTFWLADNLILLGELDRARDLFEKLLSYTNDLGLIAEEIDPNTGDMLGNFPQAFSHMGIINTAVQLQKAQRKADLPG